MHATADGAYSCVHCWGQRTCWVPAGHPSQSWYLYEHLSIERTMPSTLYNLKIMSGPLPQGRPLRGKASRFRQLHHPQLALCGNTGGIVYLVRMQGMALIVVATLLRGCVLSLTYAHKISIPEFRCRRRPAAAPHGQLSGSHNFGAKGSGIWIILEYYYFAYLYTARLLGSKMSCPTRYWMELLSRVQQSRCNPSTHWALEVCFAKSLQTVSVIVSCYLPSTALRHMGIASHRTGRHDLLSSDIGNKQRRVETTRTHLNASASSLPI